MPVPSSISDLSQTPGSNSPQGSENVGTDMNEYIQAAFAFIAQLNATLNPIGTLTAPAGTRLVMQQAAAPAGWTVDTAAAFTDCAMRFNQTVTQGGTTNWSAFNYGNTLTSSSTAITTAQMPSHNHGINDPGHAHATAVGDPGHNHGVNDPGHSHSFNVSSGWSSGGSVDGTADGPNIGTRQTNGSGTGIYLSASGTGVTVGIYGSATGISTQANGSGQGHTHTITTPQVKFADCIVAIKS